jgi:hypothetical protein
MPRNAVLVIALESDWDLPDMTEGSGEPSTRTGFGRVPAPPSIGQGRPHWWADDERAFILDPSAGSIRIAGKSTVVFLSCRQEWQLLSGDQTVIVWQSGKPFVYPGRPLPSVSEGSGQCGTKLRVQPAALTIAPAPLSHLYILSEAVGVRSVPLTLHNGFTCPLPPSSESRTRHFHRSVAMDRESPVGRLDRPCAIIDDHESRAA